jgi:hypothetical protein
MSDTDLRGIPAEMDTLNDGEHLHLNLETINVFDASNDVPNTLMVSRSRCKCSPSLSVFISAGIPQSDGDHGKLRSCGSFSMVKRNKLSMKTPLSLKN